MVLGGVVGVCGAFGIVARLPFQLQLVAGAFFDVRCFLAARVERFAVAFARAVLWTRFVRLVLVVRRFAMRTS